MWGSFKITSRNPQKCWVLLKFGVYAEQGLLKEINLKNIFTKNSKFKKDAIQEVVNYNGYEIWPNPTAVKKIKIKIK